MHELVLHELVLMSFFSWIYDAILKAVEQLIWWAFIKGPLLLVEIFQVVIEFIATQLFFTLFFDGKQTFSFNSIPNQFWYFAFIAVFVWAFVMVINYMTIGFDGNLDAKTRILKSLKLSLMAIFIIFMIPIGFFMMSFFVEFLLKLLNASFSNGTTSISKILYKLGDPNWDGRSTDNIPSDFSCPDNIADYNIFIEILAVVVVCILFVLLGMTITVKVFELYLLFLIGPFLAVTMIFDDGKKMNEWKNFVIGKFISSLGVVLIINIYSSLIVITIYAAPSSWNAFEKCGYIILIILGGGVFALGAPSLLGHFINEQMNITDTMSSVSSATSLFTMSSFFKGAKSFIGKGIKRGKNNNQSSKLSQTNGMEETDNDYIDGNDSGGIGSLKEKTVKNNSISNRKMAFGSNNSRVRVSSYLSSDKTKSNESQNKMNTSSGTSSGRKNNLNFNSNLLRDIEGRLNKLKNQKIDIKAKMSVDKSELEKVKNESSKPIIKEVHEKYIKDKKR